MNPGRGSPEIRKAPAPAMRTPVAIKATVAAVLFVHPEIAKGTIERASKSIESPNRVEEKSTKTCRYGRVASQRS